MKKKEEILAALLQLEKQLVRAAVKGKRRTRPRRTKQKAS